MPPIKCMNIYFAKAVIGKKKRAIKTNAIKYLYAPQYDTLSIKKVLDFAAAYAGFEDYMPDAKDVPLLPRQVSH